MTINPEEVTHRKVTWDIAASLVEPIVEKHGLEIYRPGAPLGHSTTVTPTDQHVDHILRVANWLLGKED